MPFHRAQKTLVLQGPTPSHLPSYWIYTHQEHYAQGHVNHKCINSYLVIQEFKISELEKEVKEGEKRDAVDSADTRAAQRDLRRLQVPVRILPQLFFPVLRIRDVYPGSKNSNKRVVWTNLLSFLFFTTNPPTQWNLRGDTWSGVEYSTWKKKNPKIPHVRNATYNFFATDCTFLRILISEKEFP